MKQYHFYGWENVDQIYAENPIYPGIETPLDLYDRLAELWCAETCAPRLRDRWTPENKTLGQCSITAFLTQDIFGGEVFAMPTKTGGLHCYNRVNGVVFDLTSKQFSGQEAKTMVYDCSLPQERESANHFFKEEKRQRYLYLKEKLSK